MPPDWRAHIKQSDNVVGHEVVAIRPGVARTAAVAAAVHDDDGVVRSESLYLITPIVRVGETAVQKDDRRTVADARVIEIDAVDLGATGVLAGDIPPWEVAGRSLRKCRNWLQALW